MKNRLSIIFYEKNNVAKDEIKENNIDEFYQTKISLENNKVNDSLTLPKDNTLNIKKVSENNISPTVENYSSIISNKDSDSHSMYEDLSFLLDHDDKLEKEETIEENDLGYLSDIESILNEEPGVKRKLLILHGRTNKTNSRLLKFPQ